MRNKKKICVRVLLLLLLFVLSPFTVKAEEQNEKDDVVIILDVSGSVKNTDENRLAFESIEAFLNICDSGDRLGVVAFNDGIVMNSGLVEVDNKADVESLKSQMMQVQYSGDTDNGLGLLTGLQILKEQSSPNRNRVLIFIADGETDLPREGQRSEDESKQDMEQAIIDADACQIPIYTIGFTSSQSEVLDQLTAISAETGGKSSICTGPLQMMNNIVNIAHQYKGSDTMENRTIAVGSDPTEENVTISENNLKEICLVFQSQTKILDFRIVGGSNAYEITETSHSRIIKAKNPVPETLKMVYRCEGEGSGILSTITVAKPQQEIVSETESSQEIIVTQEPQTEIIIDEPKNNLEHVILAIVVGIVMMALVLCGVIVWIFFHPKKNQMEEPELSGYLKACFMDLKSKNEIPDITWNLREYPPEGVTLKELFHGVKLQEDQPQLDKICFYPAEEGKGLLLVHCSDGGIFVEDKSITANVPAKVNDGDRVYVAFADNASELVMQYTEKPTEEDLVWEEKRK